MTSSQPWRDGFWYVKDMNTLLIRLSGSKYEYHGMIVLDYPDNPAAFAGTLVSGEFGETPENVREVSGGVKRYNVQFQSERMERFGVLSDDGTRITLKSFLPGKVDVMMWMDEEKLREMRESRDDVNAPSLPSYYKIQPEKKGKLLWFTGPPGSGKSTCAQLMGRNHGYTYYEGDAFFSMVNPYIDVHAANPTFAVMNQKSLKGIPTSLIEKMMKLSKSSKEMMQGNIEPLKVMYPKLIPEFAEAITKQRQRVGGDMATAWGIVSREHREQARSCFGGDVIFLVMNQTKECMIKRVEQRHGKKKEELEYVFKMYEHYEPAGEDEVNTYNVTITEDMSPDDVVAQVQNILSKLS